MILSLGSNSKTLAEIEIQNYLFAAFIMQPFVGLLRYCVDDLRTFNSKYFYQKIVQHI
jgi:hypothetical protein